MIVLYFRSIGFKVVGVILSLCLVLPVYPQPSQYPVKHLDLLSISEKSDAPLLIGIKVYIDNPLKFDFILDEGASGIPEDKLKAQAQKLVRYFLAALTVPEKDLWVNLSPYERNRIIPPALGQTDMGKDMLSEDYLLKRLAASLTYPESEAGKKYWDTVNNYKLKGNSSLRAIAKQSLYFNKVWIVPGPTTIYQDKNRAFITEAKLKVMTEGDYLKKFDLKNTDDVFKKDILPLIEKDVNEGKNFSELRQVYNCLLLALWYKDALKESIVNQLYSDKNKVAGVDIKDPSAKDRIYERYIQAFKKGAYDYVKSERVGSRLASTFAHGRAGPAPTSMKIIKRQYFSGGAAFKGALASADKQPYHLPVVNEHLAQGNCRRVEMALKPEQKGKNIIDASDLSTGRLLVDKINQVKKQEHVQSDAVSQELYNDLTATGEEILRAHYPYLNETGKARHAQIRKLTKLMRVEGFTWDEERFQELKGLLDSIPTVENFCFDLTVDVFPGIEKRDLSALFFAMYYDNKSHLITTELSSRCRNPCAFCNCGRHDSKMRHIPFIMFIKMIQYLDVNFDERVSILPYMHSNSYDYRDASINATFADIIDGLKKIGHNKGMSINVDPTDFSHSGIMDHVAKRVDSGVAISLHTMHDHVLKRYALPFYRGLISSDEAERLLADIKMDYLRQYRAAISQTFKLNGDRCSVVVNDSLSQLSQEDPVPQAKEVYAAVWRKYPKVKAIFDRLTQLQTEVVAQLESEFSFPMKLYRTDRQVDRAFIAARLKPGVNADDFHAALRQRLKNTFDSISFGSAKEKVMSFDRNRNDLASYLKSVVIDGISPKELVEMVQYYWGHDYVMGILPKAPGVDGPKIFRQLVKQVVAIFYSRIADWSWGTSDYLQGHWADWLVDKFGMARVDFEALMQLRDYGQKGSDIYNFSQPDISVNPAGEIIFNGFERQGQRFRKVGEMFTGASDRHFIQLVKFLQIMTHSRETGLINNKTIVFVGTMRDAGLSFEGEDYTDVIIEMPRGCYHALKAGYFPGGRLETLVGTPGSRVDYAAVYAAFKDVPMPIQLELYTARRVAGELIPIQPLAYQFISDRHSQYAINIYSVLNRFTLPVKAWESGSEFIAPIEDEPLREVTGPGPAASAARLGNNGGVDWQNTGARIKLQGRRAQFLIPIDNVAIDPKTFRGFSGNILAMETIDREE